jgi:hypothetical protein
MNFTKLHYEAPASELFEVRMEQGFLDLSRGVNYSNVRGGVSGDDEYNDYDEL